MGRKVTMEKTRKHSKTTPATMDIEDLLWILLPSIQLYCYGCYWWPTWITLVHVLCYIIFFRRNNIPSASSPSSLLSEEESTSDNRSNEVSVSRNNTKKNGNNSSSSSSSNNNNTAKQPAHPDKCCDNRSTSTAAAAAASNNARRRNEDDHGIIASIILPTSLLSSMSYYNSYWIIHCKVVCILSIVGFGRTTKSTTSIAFVGVIIGIVFKQKLEEVNDHQQQDDPCSSSLLDSMKSIVLIVVYFTMQKMDNVRRRLLQDAVVTIGEYDIVCWIITITVSEYITWCIQLILLILRSYDDDYEDDDDDDSHYFVSLSGVVGCIISSYTISKLKKTMMMLLSSTSTVSSISLLSTSTVNHDKNSSSNNNNNSSSKNESIALYSKTKNIILRNECWFRLGAHAIGPLIVVELSLRLLYYRDQEQYYYYEEKLEQHSLQSLQKQYIPYWIVFLSQFLGSSEVEPFMNSDHDDGSSCRNSSGQCNNNYSSYPRYYGLAYWMVAIFILGIPTIVWVLGNVNDAEDHDATSTTTYGNNGDVNSIITKSKSTCLSSTATATADAHPISTDSSSNIYGKRDEQAIRPSRSIPSSSSKQATSSSYVVIHRKWFHLIAIILFGPITWYMPQLMSLGYAIAICLLVIVECCNLRTQFHGLNHFYQSFLDDSKDTIIPTTVATTTSTTTIKTTTSRTSEDEHIKNPIVVSHIFLILGCAAPLWVANCCFQVPTETTRISSQQSSLFGLRYLQLWGVLCLGVGDAMGACVGKLYGRHRWGKNQRTMEGSLAMLLSIVAAASMLVGSASCTNAEERFSFLERLDITQGFSWTALLVSTAYATLLEAFTLQMDNLVLPLAGAALILTLGPKNSV